MTTEKRTIEKSVGRIVSDAIWPGKRITFNKKEQLQFKSVLENDKSYLYNIGVDAEEIPVVGMYESTKFNRSIAYFSNQEKTFLELIEDSPLVTNVVEKPVELVYEDEYCSTFLVNYLIHVRGGNGIMVMLMPYEHFTTQSTQRMWHALQTYCAECGYGCVLYDIEKVIGLKRILRLGEKRNLTDLCENLKTALEAKQCHWLNCFDINKILDTCNANTFDLQMAVLKMNLLFIPKSAKQHVTLIGSGKENMFDSKLMTTTYCFTNHA